MKIFFRRIHLYLSLAAGLVILIACLTGAILVFEKDLQMALNKDRYFVPQTGTRLPVEQLVKGAKEAYPGVKVTGVKVYDAANRTVEIAASAPPAKEKGTPAANQQGGKAKAAAPKERQPGFTLFVNPYTGQVLEKYSYRETFFYQVFALHRWLLGTPDSIGKTIVGVATLIFLFILITGIILWWPKTRKVLSQRLRVKSDGGWKRLNHDLHIVLGFYSAIFLFVFAFTGLAWSFEWFNKGIYKVTASPMQAPPAPKSMYAEGTQRISFDHALATAKEVYAAAKFYNIALPKDSADAVNVTILGNEAAHEGATDALYIDQYSGKIAGELKFDNRSLGARVRSTFKPVHTGSIWGMPSKIIAFLVCLLGVSFPITGTIMWINRTRKKNSKSPVKQRPLATVTE